MEETVLYLTLAYAGVFAYKNSDEFINEINTKQNLWIAGRNFPKETNWSTIKDLLGAKNLPKDVLDSTPVLQHDLNETDEIPEYFDSRTKWPNCKVINIIADQSACGSCWAVSVASAISDRICIHSGGKLQPQMSASNLMSCSAASNGCAGGYPYYAWKYWITAGLVTGGAYGSKIGCQSYPFAQCEHHITNGTKPKCPSETYSTPKCTKQCDKTSLNYFNDLTYGKSAYVISEDERNIQAEIMKNGPVVAGFIVYSDFFHYKSGVYVATSETFEGGHAVRVLGWGVVENGTKYWLVANSWNEDWGDKGLFKIRRGVNECFFEKAINAGLPSI